MDDKPSRSPATHLTVRYDPVVCGRHRYSASRLATTQKPTVCRSSFLVVTLLELGLDYIDSDLLGSPFLLCVSHGSQINALKLLKPVLDHISNFMLMTKVTRAQACNNINTECTSV